MILTWSNQLMAGGAPAPFWQSFSMVAGTSIDWVGYVSVASGLTNPAGSITREPYTGSLLNMLVYDPVAKQVFITFEGNILTELSGRMLEIGGARYRFAGVGYDAGQDQTMAYFDYPEPFFVDGAMYFVEFPVLVPWTPLELGPKLFAWWDAEDSDSLSLAGSIVNSWTDRKAGIIVSQAVSASKPAFVSTAINGRPGIVYDGADDSLRAALDPMPLPLGSAPLEVWTLLDQTSDATVVDRRIFSYGTSLMTARIQRKTATAGQQIANTLVGTGSGSVTANGPLSIPLLGIHYIRSTFSATETATYIDGVFGSMTNAVPATSATAVGVGSNYSGSQTFTGSINSVVLTDRLTDYEVILLNQFYKMRGGI